MDWVESFWYRIEIEIDIAVRKSFQHKGLFDIPPNWQESWKGMPSFNQEDKTPYQSVSVHFDSPEDRELFSRLIDRKLTSRTRSVWYPREKIGRYVDKLFVSERSVDPRYPIYIISKGRWESRLTSRALEAMKVTYRIVVDPQEYDDYAAVIHPDKILTLPFSDLGQGSIPARNWVWENAVASGANRHWILDDNLNCFYRLYNNIKILVGCGNVFRAAEDFVDRYENIAISGFNYFMFASRKTVIPPYYLNTRIYSCILIKNDLPYRWRGRYNEDTDLWLRILKDGWCSVLFNAFLAWKMTTMTMKGGNTDELYRGDGRWEMAESLRKQHPDVLTITQKWNRWQHSVDYSRFKRNKLQPKRTAFVSDGVDNCGMYLKQLDKQNRLLLIGQAPSKSGDLGDPLGGKIGRRMASLAGVSFEQFLGCSDRINMFDEWMGKKGKGDLWDGKLAKERAVELLPLLQDRVVFFVGRNVADAFGQKIPWLKWQESEVASKIAVIPHPSGIVLWWNKKENRTAAKVFMKETFAMENEK